MSLRGHQHRQPTVYVTEPDYERLANLAESGDTRGSRLLAEELERAVIVRDEEVRRPFVRLNSQVEFSDLTTGRSRRVEVVTPDEADIDRNRLSVVTPVGAALIGLPVGETIGLRMEDGRAHVLVVLDVGAPA
jgi:regulator of nucleoside diphosphate kinase